MRYENKFILVMALSIITFFATSFVTNNLHLFGRFFHLIFPLSDADAFVITDKEFRWDRNSLKTYEMPCRYYDIYEIGFRTDKKVLNGGMHNKKTEIYSFNGILQIRIFNGQTVLYEKVVSEPVASWYFEDNIHIKRVSLDTFPIPLRGHCSGLRIEVKLISADKYLQSVADPELYVRLSTVP